MKILRQINLSRLLACVEIDSSGYHNENILPTLVRCYNTHIIFFIEYQDFSSCLLINTLM